MSLHPYVIHLPIVLILLWPIVDACGVAFHRPDVSKVGLALLIASIAAALAATTTGQTAFDEAVKAHVDPELLDTHADKANPFPWLLLGVAAVRTIGVLKLKRKAHVAAILLGFALWPLIYAVGESGGALVYEHAIGVKTAEPGGPRP
jgi:uncharacterized membrane protein